MHPGGYSEITALAICSAQATIGGTHFSRPTCLWKNRVGMCTPC